MTSQDVDNYKQIKSDLDQLRSIVEKSELWVYKRQGEDGMDADGPSESDNKKKVLGNTQLENYIQQKSVGADFLKRIYICCFAPYRETLRYQTGEKGPAITTTGL